VNFEETLSELQDLLGTVVFVGIGPFEPGGPAMPAVAGLVGVLTRAESGILWPAAADDEHVAFEVGDVRNQQGGYFALVRSIFDVGQWVDAPAGRELAIIQASSHITVGQPPVVAGD
jgi:hypothetical protein